MQLPCRPESRQRVFRSSGIDRIRLFPGPLHLHIPIVCRTGGLCSSQRGCRASPRICPDQRRSAQPRKLCVCVNKRFARGHRVAGSVLEHGISQDMRNYNDPQQRESELRAGIGGEYDVRLPDGGHRPDQARAERFQEAKARVVR